jgi:hypothetical protein
MQDLAVVENMRASLSQLRREDFTGFGRLPSHLDGFNVRVRSDVSKERRRALLIAFGTLLIEVGLGDLGIYDVTGPPDQEDELVISSYSVVGSIA